MIDSMNGPTFLGFYGILIAITLINAQFQRKKIDYFNSTQNLKIPNNPDPYEISYLRAGKYEVIRLIIFELYSKGYLSETGLEGQYTLTKEYNIDNLSELQKVIAIQFSKPKTVDEIFQDKVNFELIDTYLKKYEVKLISEELVLSDIQKNKLKRLKRISLLFILGLGFYRLWTSISNHHYNVGFLILLMILFTIAINIVCRKGYLSKKGEAYLEKIKLVMSNLKEIPKNSSKENLEPNMSLALGVYGFPILAGTTFASDFETIFKKKPDYISESSSYSSCSYSYSSSCSSSSCNSDSSCNSGSSCSSSCGGGGCGGGGSSD